MNVVKSKDMGVGVIIGRFQVPDLHIAHKNLIESVCTEHEKVIIFLGLSPVFDSNDPLDFEARKQMILESFPNIIVGYIPDTPDDINWCAKLDEQIRYLIGPKQTVVLYGSRDSFIQKYTGVFKTVELIQDHWVSGKEIRAMIKNQVKATKDFRHGAIWESWQRYDTVYTTVDIAIVDEKNRILLGRKRNEKGWRLIGGFIDPKDESNEASAMREVTEEVPGIEIEKITAKNYIGSFNIDDWRYRGKTDCIRTLLYKAKYLFGDGVAADDIAETRWFDLDKIVDNDLVSEHVKLVNAIRNKDESIKK